jgi:hypothetical protein
MDIVIDGNTPVRRENRAAEWIDLTAGDYFEADGLRRQIDAADAGKQRQTAHRPSPFTTQAESASPFPYLPARFPATLA